MGPNQAKRIRTGDRAEPQVLSKQITSDGSTKPSGYGVIMKLVGHRTQCCNVVRRSLRNHFSRIRPGHHHPPPPPALFSLRLDLSSPCYLRHTTSFYTQDHSTHWSGARRLFLTLPLVSRPGNHPRCPPARTNCTVYSFRKRLHRIPSQGARPVCGSRSFTYVRRCTVTVLGTLAYWSDESRVWDCQIGAAI
jgi:hypothetical protein